jgi:hypothetical protein
MGTLKGNARSEIGEHWTEKYSHFERRMFRFKKKNYGNAPVLRYTYFACFVELMFFNILDVRALARVCVCVCVCVHCSLAFVVHRTSLKLRKCKHLGS